MYPNLEAEMARNSVNSDYIAKVIGKDPRTARNKISGATSWLFEETVIIRDRCFPYMTLEALFAKQNRR